MSIESKIDELIEAVNANTKALLGGPSAGKDAAPSTKDEDKSSRRGGRAAADKPKDGPTETEVKEKVAKFIDLPEGKDGDAEYNRRLEKVLDPILEKGGAKELKDLPEKYYGELLEAIADYEKANAEPSTTRRSRGR